MYFAHFHTCIHAQTMNFENRILGHRGTLRRALLTVAAVRTHTKNAYVYTQWYEIAVVC